MADVVIDKLLRECQDQLSDLQTKHSSLQGQLEEVSNIKNDLQIKVSAINHLERILY